MTKYRKFTFANVFKKWLTKFGMDTQSGPFMYNFFGHRFLGIEKYEQIFREMTGIQIFYYLKFHWVIVEWHLLTLTIFTILAVLN